MSFLLKVKTRINSGEVQCTFVVSPCSESLRLQISDAVRSSTSFWHFHTILDCN